jgi:hypothetical protein
MVYSSASFISVSVQMRNGCLDWDRKSAWQVRSDYELACWYGDQGTVSRMKVSDFKSRG